MFFVAIVCFIFVVVAFHHVIMHIASPCFHKIVVVRGCHFFLVSFDLLSDQPDRSFLSCILRGPFVFVDLSQTLVRARKLPGTRPARSSSLGPDHPQTSLKHLRFLTFLAYLSRAVRLRSEGPTPSKNPFAINMQATLSPSRPIHPFHSRSRRHPLSLFPRELVPSLPVSFILGILPDFHLPNPSILPTSRSPWRLFSLPSSSARARRSRGARGLHSEASSSQLPRLQQLHDLLQLPPRRHLQARCLCLTHRTLASLRPLPHRAAACFHL
ncbi:hypothetical protein VPH35_077710 [Triticum aestivum]